MKGVRARKDYSLASETDGIEIKKGGVTLLRKPSQVKRHKTILDRSSEDLG